MWALGCASLLACGPSTPSLTSDQLQGKQSMVVLLEGASGFTAEARPLSAGGDGVRLDTTTVDRVTLLLYNEPLQALPGLSAGPLSLASDGAELPPQDAAFELVLDADDRRWRQVDALRDVVAAVRLARGGPGPTTPSVCDPPKKIEYVQLTASTATTTSVVFLERAEGRDVLIGTNDHQLWRVRVGTETSAATAITLPRNRPGAGAGWLDHTGRRLWVSSGTDLVTYDVGPDSSTVATVQVQVQRLPGFVNHLSGPPRHGGPPRQDDHVLLATTSNAEVLRIDIDARSVDRLGMATTSAEPTYYQDMRVLRTSSVTVLTQGVSSYWEIKPTGLERLLLPGEDLGCNGGRVGRGTVWRNDIVAALVGCGMGFDVGLAGLSGARNWVKVAKDELNNVGTNEEPRSMAALRATLFVGHADSYYSRYSDDGWCRAQRYGDDPGAARLQLNFAVAIDEKTVVVAGPRVNGDRVGPLAIGVLRFPL